MHRNIFIASGDLCNYLIKCRDVRKWLTTMKNGIFRKINWNRLHPKNVDSMPTRNYNIGSRRPILYKTWARDLKCMFGKPNNLYVWWHDICAICILVCVISQIYLPLNVFQAHLFPFHSFQPPKFTFDINFRRYAIASKSRSSRKNLIKWTLL